MLKEIIVVEGKSDTAAIRRALEADTIETGGSAINSEILGRIALAQARRGVIIFTDPDHAGERLRKIISSRISGCKHAFLAQEHAMNKSDIGVENASVESILQSLRHVRTESEHEESRILWEDLMDAGLVGRANSAERRLVMGNLLGIGCCNGKQFYKRCRMFQITPEEFGDALNQLGK